MCSKILIDIFHKWKYYILHLWNIFVDFYQKNTEEKAVC